MSEQESTLLGDGMTLVGDPAEGPLGVSAVETDDDIVIEVVDERPAEDQVDVRVDDDKNSESSDDEFDKELETIGGRTQKRIAKLKYEYHEERRAKEQAERLREEAIQFAKITQGRVQELETFMQNGEKVLLSEIKARTNADLERARERFRSANEDGNADEILKASEELNQAQIERHQAEIYQPAPVSPQGPNQPAQAAPVQPAADPKFNDWKGKNDWWESDVEMTMFALGVHKTITEKDGISPTSDEYYNRIDSRMRETFPDKFGTVGTREPDAGPAPTVVASSTRKMSDGKPRKLHLTQSQVDLAKALRLTPQQYAQQVLKDKANNG